MPTSRFVVPTDLSPAAAHACHRAAMLARDVRGDLELVHIGSNPPWEELREMEHAVQQRHGVPSSVHVAPGPVLQGILEHADGLAAEMVIVGVSTPRNLRQTFLGSTAERLISRVPCPLLAVRRPPREAYRSLLLPVDFSPASLPAIRLARRVSPQAEITLLHVFEAPTDDLSLFADPAPEVLQLYHAAAHRDAMQRLIELSEAAELQRHRFRLLARHGHPVREIVEQARIDHTDLIVMGKGQHALEDLILGSVTRRVMAESDCDLLVFR